MINQEVPAQKKRRLPFSVAWLFAFLGIILCCGWPITDNHLRHQQFVGSVHNYPLPPKTAVVSKFAHFGGRTIPDFYFDRIRCGSLAGQTLVSTLSREEIEAYYQHSSLHYPDVAAYRTMAEAYQTLDMEVAEARVLLGTEVSPQEDIQIYVVTSSPGEWAYSTADVRCYIDAWLRPY